MKILNKILVTFFIMLNVCNLSFAAQINAKPKLIWECHSKNTNEIINDDPCNLYLIENNKKKLILEGDQFIMNHTTFNYLELPLVEIHTGCGSDCTLSSFYDLEKECLSEAYYSVLAINGKDKLIVTSDKGGITLIDIYYNEKKKLLIPSNHLSHISAIQSNSVNSVYFKNNKIYISYLDQNDQEKNAIFDQNLPVPSKRKISINYFKIKESILDFPFFHEKI